MIGLSISLLWLAIGVIILAVVIWLVLNVVGHFFPGVISANVAYAVWTIFAILILIYVLMTLNGGGVPRLGLK